MTKVAVCEEISRKIEAANNLKVRNAASVHFFLAFEQSFWETHDWVNKTGVGVKAVDGKITFDEAVKKGLHTMLRWSTSCLRGHWHAQRKILTT